MKTIQKKWKVGDDFEFGFAASEKFVERSGGGLGAGAAILQVAFGTIGEIVLAYADVDRQQKRDAEHDKEKSLLLQIHQPTNPALFTVSARSF